MSDRLPAARPSNGKLLVFDLGNVILRHDNELLLRNLAARCPDPAAAAAALKQALDKETFSAGKGTLAELFAIVGPAIRFDGDYATFAELYCSHFTHDPAMEALVEDLASRHRLVILSNTDAVHWAHIMRDYPVMQAPHALYTSFELGLTKPGWEIYQHVLKAEGFAAADSIFIDDRIDNVEGARALGMTGIHFTGDAAALKAELSGLGVA